MTIEDREAEGLVLRYIADRERWERDQAHLSAPYMSSSSIPAELVLRRDRSYRELLSQYFVDTAVNAHGSTWGIPPDVRIEGTMVESTRLTRTGAIVTTTEARAPGDVGTYEYVLVRVGDELRIKDRRSGGITGLF